MKEELQLKVITTIKELSKKNAKLKEENELLKAKLNDLENSTTHSKMIEYDKLVDELTEQKKEYIGLIHDMKKLKRKLELELLRVVK